MKKLTSSCKYLSLLIILAASIGCANASISTVIIPAGGIAKISLVKQKLDPSKSYQIDCDLSGMEPGSTLAFGLIKNSSHTDPVPPQALLYIGHDNQGLKYINTMYNDFNVSYLVPNGAQSIQYRATSYNPYFTSGLEFKNLGKQNVAVKNCRITISNS